MKSTTSSRTTIHDENEQNMSRHGQRHLPENEEERNMTGMARSVRRPTTQKHRTPKTCNTCRQNRGPGQPHTATNFFLAVPAKGKHWAADAHETLEHNHFVQACTITATCHANMSTILSTSCFVTQRGTHPMSTGAASGWWWRWWSDFVQLIGWHKILVVHVLFGIQSDAEQNPANLTCTIFPGPFL